MDVFQMQFAYGKRFMVDKWFLREALGIIRSPMMGAMAGSQPLQVGKHFAWTDDEGWFWSRLSILQVAMDVWVHSMCIAKDYPEDTWALVNENDIDNRMVRSFGSNSCLLSGGREGRYRPAGLWTYLQYYAHWCSQPQTNTFSPLHMKKRIPISESR